MDPTHWEPALSHQFLHVGSIYFRLALCERAPEHTDNTIAFDKCKIDREVEKKSRGDSPRLELI